MTLPSVSSRPTVIFEDFDTMASINDNSLTMHLQSFHEQAEQVQNEDLDTSNSLNNNNTDFTPTSTIMSTVATSATSVYSSQYLDVESVMPGIYFTKNFVAWNEENLRAHGFTHIIIIDKHIQELYYPSPVFKLATLKKNNEMYEPASPFDYFCSAPVPPAASLNFSKEFEAIDLNFGEKSYLTTVLPNCYRGVRFINKALQSGGTILIIDCNGGEQKCLTILVAYLMYKYNVSFSNAFERLKTYYKKADLDRFYISQLYEYEPILQVQRSHSRGHSCSRELHAAVLKRKKVDDDFSLRYEGCTAGIGGNSHYGGISSDDGDYVFNPVTRTTNELLQTFNPLSQFNAKVAHEHLTHHHQQQQQQVSTNKIGQIPKQQMISRSRSDFNTNVDILSSICHANFDDYAME